MKRRTEYELFNLMDSLITELRKHDYSKAVIMNGRVEDLKEKIYGNPIG